MHHVHLAIFVERRPSGCRSSLQMYENEPIFVNMKVALPKNAKKVTGSQDLYDIMKAILLRQNKLRRKKAYMWTIGLSSFGDIEYIELISIGALKVGEIEPIEVYNIAVLKKCRKFVIIHNHPEGNLEPTAEERKITNRLQAGGMVLKIELVDHLIIHETKGYYSFSDKGKLKW